MRILLGDDAKELRALFVMAFIDTESEYYRDHIQQLTAFSDGLHYTGYLWDCMKNRQILSFAAVLNGLEDSKNALYVLWDDHSSDRIKIKDYWKYPRDAVLIANPTEIKALVPLLPEDCYFFDETLSCAYALTHEEIKPGKRFCIASNN